MKAFSFTIMIFVFFTACSSNVILDNEVKQSVTIAGKVLNNNDFPDDYLIKIIINDISQSGQRNHTVIIEDNGTFQIEFLKRIPQDIYLKFGKKLLTLFVHPGDSLYVEFDANEFINPPPDNRHITNSLKFSGDAAGINQELIDFLPQFYGQRDSRGYNDKVKTLSQDEFKDFILERRDREHLLLKTYITTNKSSKEFIDWVTHYIDYDAGSELLRYLWYNPMLNRAKPELPDLNDKYFDFLEYIPLDNQPASICSSYKKYLSEYSLIKRREVRSINKEILSSKERNLVLETELFADYLTKSISGYPLEVMLTQSFTLLLENAEEIERYEELYAHYNDQITDWNLEQSISDKYTTVKLQSNSSGENGYAFSNRQSNVYNINDVLSSVISENIGKVIYIDFWATWCGPCLMEMPSSAVLKSEYKDENVSFIYFCVNSRKDEWENAIVENKIKGSNYLLNDSQYGVLGDLFKINGIPHHVLINSVGEIANPKAPRPGTREIRIELDKLLGK